MGPATRRNEQVVADRVVTLLRVTDLGLEARATYYRASNYNRQTGELDLEAAPMFAATA